MMRKLSCSLLGVAAIAFGLSGCSNQYFERKDTITFGAGDAVAWNNAQMIADPTPRYASNTNIVTPGETAARAGSDYAHGRFRWYSEPGGVDEPKDTMVSVGASNGGGMGAGAAAGAGAALSGGGAGGGAYGGQ